MTTFSVISVDEREIKRASLLGSQQALDAILNSRSLLSRSGVRLRVNETHTITQIIKSIHNLPKCLLSFECMREWNRPKVVGTLVLKMGHSVQESIPHNKTIQIVMMIIKETNNQTFDLYKHKNAAHKKRNTSSERAS